MAFDGVFIHYLTKSLKRDLLHTRIKKIRQVQSDLFLFTYHKDSTKHIRFSLKPNQAWIRIDETDLPFDSKSNFLTTLKKHLENALIKDIYQEKKDRVIVFVFEKFDPIFGSSIYKLAFESMGRVTNLILYDDQKIIDAYYKTFSADSRSVLINAPFEFFQTDKIMLDESSQTILNGLDSPKAISDTFMGFSNQSAQFLYAHKHLDIYNLNVEPTLYTNAKKRYFSAFDLGYDFNKETFDTLYALLEKLEEKTINKDDRLLSVLDKEIKKRKIKLANLSQDLEENQNFGTYKDMADQIYMSGYPLEDKLSSLNGIKLDSQKTLNENAQLYYSKYRKAKKSLEPIINQLEINQGFLTYLNEKRDLYFMLDDTDLKDLNIELENLGLIKKSTQKTHKQKTVIKPLVIERSDYTIYIGKSSIQNDYLTNQFALNDDFWFHVQHGPGAHVILRGAFHEESLRLAAMLAAYYSPMRESSSIPVDYTRIKHVKKIKGLPGYHVRYTNQKTLYIDIDMPTIQQAYPSLRK